MATVLIFMLNSANRNLSRHRSGASTTRHVQTCSCAICFLRENTSITNACSDCWEKKWRPLHYMTLTWISRHVRNRKVYPMVSYCVSICAAQHFMKLYDYVNTHPFPSKNVTSRYMTLHHAAPHSPFNIHHKTAAFIFASTFPFTFIFTCTGPVLSHWYVLMYVYTYIDIDSSMELWTNGPERRPSGPVF